MFVQHQRTLIVATHGIGLVDITRDVGQWLGTRQVLFGLLTLFCRHTSASLTIQENASPAVREDIVAFFARLAPEDGGYAHADEGPDDMPAHLRTMLTSTTLAVPVTAGRLALGVWQAIYLFEHRARPHRREIVLHFAGE